ALPRPRGVQLHVVGPEHYPTVRRHVRGGDVLDRPAGVVERGLARGDEAQQVGWHARAGGLLGAALAARAQVAGERPIEVDDRGALPGADAPLRTKNDD